MELCVVFIMILLMKGDEEYREIFNSLMLDLVEELDPTWRESGQVEFTPPSIPKYDSFHPPCLSFFLVINDMWKK